MVRQALDQIKPYLAAYLEQTIGRASLTRARAGANADVQALVSVMLTHWETDFAARLSVTVRHYVHELRDIRNRWAHEEDFADDEVERAVDTARLVAKSIGAPKQVTDTLMKRVRGLQRIDSDQAPAEQKPAPAVRSTAAPKWNAHGVITNAGELTAADVALQRVTCPGCEEKVFETWPGGWDAHATHVCRGVSGATEAERKADFRRQFGHLFRGDGATATPSKQRDVMRRIWAIQSPDEARAIREYAAAEQRGEVARARNSYNVSAEEYARRLLADGFKKGWLSRS